MKQLARLLAGLGVVAGCQSGSSAPPAPEASRQNIAAPAPGASRPDIAPPVSDAYRQDIARLCDVLVQADAGQLPPDQRMLAVASWLGAHLETQDAHAYLARIQPLTGEPKAAALEAEARRVGLASCALAAAWRADPGH